MKKKEESKTATGYPPMDFSGLKTFPMRHREHKVDLTGQVKLPEPAASAGEFLESFPDFLGARQMRFLAEAMAAAICRKRPVFWAMGAHVIKVGCSGIVIDLMRRGLIRGIALNGAGAIHDFEMALQGQTSEEVGSTLNQGRFGMTEEAPAMLAQAAKQGREKGCGFGAALGRLIVEQNLKYKEYSLFAQAYQLGITTTVHVAIGTDTVHMHPQADGADIGEASHIDFRKLCSMVADLAGGGVWVNIGSAVILPEVFLKAVSVARNQGVDLDEMVTGNLDMLGQYRVDQNVLKRPTQPGRGFEVRGQHEITLPLLRLWLLKCLESQTKS